MNTAFIFQVIKLRTIEQMIRHCNWFKGVPDEAYHELIKAARIKYFADKKYLYRLGDTTESVYGVISGFVRVKISSIEGQEFAITEFSTDSWLGEYLLSDQPVRMFEAQVLEKSSIIELPKWVVQSVAEKYPVVYKNLFLEQSDRTLEMCKLLSGMLFYPLKARLAGRLFWFAQHYGNDVDEGVFIDKKMSQSELADLTLGSRQRINKIIKEFEAKDILSTNGQRYLVKNMAALKSEIKIKR
ncbi:MAG: CRP/FNR family cyclic AMP-dependent transcriptional regulator [Alteromonadaceae bacterium]